MKNEREKVTFAENFTLTGIAACLSKTVAAPIERVKLLIQNQGELIKQRVLDKPYSGIANCTYRTYQSDGLVAFWRGNWASVIRYIPMQAMNFAFKDSIKAQFKVTPNDSKTKQLYRNTVSGGIAGAISVTVIYSLDFARERLGADLRDKDGKRKYTGIVDVYRKIWRTDGIRGLYRGYSLSVVGIFIYRGIYFGLYDSIKPILTEHGMNIGFMKSFALGYCVTVLASVVPYPTDTVRRRMMMTSGTGQHYSGVVSAASEMIRNEGFKTLYKGWGANVLRSLAGGLVLAGSDTIKEFYLAQRKSRNVTNPPAVRL